MQPLRGAADPNSRASSSPNEQGRTSAVDLGGAALDTYRPGPLRSRERLLFYVALWPVAYLQDGAVKLGSWSARGRLGCPENPFLVVVPDPRPADPVPLDTIADDR